MVQRMKGFVLTFSAFMLVSIVLLFSIFYLQINQEREAETIAGTRILKAGFVADDIETDLNELFGFETKIDRKQTETIIEFSGAVPCGLSIGKLNAWKNLIEGDYASLQNSSIEIDTTRLSDNTGEILFSNGLQFDCFYSNPNHVKFYLPGGDTEATKIDLNIYVDSDSKSSTPWTWQDATGDLIVNLNYQDENADATVLHYGKIDSSIDNSYTFSFQGGKTVSINIGAVDGDLKVVKLTEALTGQKKADVWIEITAPAEESELTAVYNADLNFTQSDVNVHRKPVAARS